MKATFQLILILTLICAICAMLLAGVYAITGEPIAKALEARTVKAAAAVLPVECDTPEKRAIDGENLFVARKDGQVAAVALEGRSANGYGGELVLMVGLSAAGKLINYRQLLASETPGLGTKIVEEPFMAQLRGKALQGDWRVTKDGGTIEAVTAATISSRAALECIRDAIARYERLAEQL